MVSALIAVHGGKPRRIEPMRIAHPDRPEPEPVKQKNVLSVAEFEKQIRSEPTTG